MDLPYPPVTPTDASRGLIWRRADKGAENDDDARPYYHIAPPTEWTSDVAYLDAHAWLVPDKADQERLLAHVPVGKSPWWLVNRRGKDMDPITDEEVDAFARTMARTLAYTFLVNAPRPRDLSANPSPTIEDPDYVIWYNNTDSLWNHNSKGKMSRKVGPYKGGRYGNTIRNAYVMLYSIGATHAREGNVIFSPERLLALRSLLGAIWVISHCSLINRAVEQVRDNTNTSRHDGSKHYLEAYERWDLSAAAIEAVEFNKEALQSLYDWMKSRPGLGDLSGTGTLSGPRVSSSIILDDPQFMITSVIDLLAVRGGHGERKRGEIVHFIAKPSVVRLTDFALPALQAALYTYQDVDRLPPQNRVVYPIERVSIFNVLLMTVTTIPLSPRYLLFMLPLVHPDGDKENVRVVEHDTSLDAGSPLHLIPRTLDEYRMMDPSPTSVSPAFVAALPGFE